MRVTTYKVMLTDNFHNMLVKEKSMNYESISHIQSPDSVYKLMTEAFQLDKMAEEYIYLLALNTKGNLNAVFELSHGTVSQSLTTPREICIRCLLCGASRFIICHNHPSGDTSPSREDIHFTKILNEASRLIGLELVDHMIIGKNHSFYSYKEHQQ